MDIPEKSRQNLVIPCFMILNINCDFFIISIIYIYINYILSIIYIYIPIISSKLGGGITLFFDGKHSSSVTNPYYNIYIYTYIHNIYIYIYLVGGLEHFLFFHILGIVTPTDFHIFQRGSSHQPDIHILVI